MGPENTASYLLAEWLLYLNELYQHCDVEFKQ